MRNNKSLFSKPKPQEHQQQQQQQDAAARQQREAELAAAMQRQQLMQFGNEDDDDDCGMMRREERVVSDGSNKVGGVNHRNALQFRSPGAGAPPRQVNNAGGNVLLPRTATDSMAVPPQRRSRGGDANDLSDPLITSNGNDIRYGMDGMSAAMQLGAMGAAASGSDRAAVGAGVPGGVFSAQQQRLFDAGDDGDRLQPAVVAAGVQREEMAGLRGDDDAPLVCRQVDFTAGYTAPARKSSSGSANVSATRNRRSSGGGGNNPAAQAPPPRRDDEFTPFTRFLDAAAVAQLLRGIPAPAVCAAGAAELAAYGPSDSWMSHAAVRSAAASAAAAAASNNSNSNNKNTSGADTSLLFDPNPFHTAVADALLQTFIGGSLAATSGPRRELHAVQSVTDADRPVVNVIVVGTFTDTLFITQQAGANAAQALQWSAKFLGALTAEMKQLVERLTDTTGRPTTKEVLNNKALFLTVANDESMSVAKRRQNFQAELLKAKAAKVHDTDASSSSSALGPRKTAVIVVRDPLLPDVATWERVYGEELSRFMAECENGAHAALIKAGPSAEGSSGARRDAPSPASASKAAAAGAAASTLRSQKLFVFSKVALLLQMDEDVRRLSLEPPTHGGMLPGSASPFAELVARGWNRLLRVEATLIA